MSDINAATRSDLGHLPADKEHLDHISHSFADESPESKARWFQSLTMEERMELLCSFTDLLLSLNPDIAERRVAEPIAGRIRVLSLT